MLVPKGPDKEFLKQQFNFQSIRETEAGYIITNNIA